MVTFKTLIISLVLSMSVYSIDALNLDFVDASFDDFIARIAIPEDQKAPFKHYYARLTIQLQEVTQTDRQMLHGYFYQNALTALKAEHPDWYTALLPFVTDPRITLDTDINDVRTVVGGFLIRYGAYQEFRTRLHAMRTSNRSVKMVLTDVWDDIGKRASRMKGTIKDWLVK
ncbi:MAG: hypothetical protein ACHQVS_02050 [Candidatus Babeliales bacterium]